MVCVIAAPPPERPLQSVGTGGDGFVQLKFTIPAPLLPPPDPTLGRLKLGWLKMLKNSARKVNPNLSPMWNVLYAEKSKLTMSGPRNIARPASPKLRAAHCPPQAPGAEDSAGATKAAWLNQQSRV